jgi:hypothetical protein
VAVLQLNVPMVTEWGQWQAVWAAAGLLVAALPGVVRAVRRRLVRVRLRQHLELAGAVRESGRPATDLDPVLTDLIALNLANLARLEARRLPNGPSNLAWRAVQAVSLLGWGLMAATAFDNVGSLGHGAVGLVISTAVIDAPLLGLAIVALDLTRFRANRGWARETEPTVVLERTHDLAAELVPTLPLGSRNTLDELLGQRSALGPLWRTGRAAVPRPRPEP